MEIKVKETIVAVAVAFFAAIAYARADTSYLLIQGPFGAAGAIETFQWQVNYPAGDLETGQDLLNVIFGSPSFSGTYYTDPYGNPYPYWTAGNGTQGAGYVDYPQYDGLFLASVTLDSTTVLQDPSYSPGWNYYVAGGGSNYGTGYTNGTWTYSNDGLDSRSLTFPGNDSDSFDAWVFGSTDDPPAVQGANYAPTAADFANATVITIVPEPGSAALLLFAAGGILATFKGRRAQRQPQP